MWSEGTFKSLLEAAPDAVVIIDREGTILLVNSQAESVFGYARTELLGEKIELLLPMRYREKHVDQRNGFFQSPHLRPMGAGIDLYGRHKDSREIPVEISLSPLQTSEGLLVTAAIRDVTERKRIEQELKEARKTADKANQSKSVFLANMSHEIRTPLAGILGYAEMLVHYCKTDAERQDYAAKIKRNADNLTDLINDILDLSKVEAGALTVERINFPIVTEIEEAVSLLRRSAEEKGLQIETSYEGSPPRTITSDPKRFRQILTNLIGNAVKFTETGKVSVRLDAGPRSSSSSSSSEGRPLLRIEVTDSGCGIPADAQPCLFQPFVQADASTTRKYGGTGLGLALSRRLARALGGDLVLSQSSEGQGSTFSFTLDPGTTIRDSNERPGRSVSPGIDDELRVDGLRVLVAEDHPDNEELIVAFLTHAGAVVDVARNGAEAVALARSEPYDIVLMDVQMPIMDGHAATEELCRNGYKTPIIAVTAHAMAEEKERCLKAGCVDSLSKPVEVKTLLSTIRMHTAKV